MGLQRSAQPTEALSSVIPFLLTILKNQGSEAMRSNASFGRNAAFATGSRDCDSNF